jgi:arylsulfatase A-like enzyme
MSRDNPSRRTVMKYAAAGAMLPAFGAATGSRAAPAKKPNILFILADDLGYADLSCFGQTDFETPRLDALAKKGCMLMQAYANSAVCSATRTALITGRYQYRLPVGLDEPVGRNPVGLPPSHPTLPSILKKSGYRTSLIGKWHLGDPPKYSPLKSGYDYFFGIVDGASDYFTHEARYAFPGQAPVRKHELYEGMEPVKRHGYMTNLLADQAITEINDYAKGDAPFMMSLHFNAPHWPWEGPNDEERAQTLTNISDYAGGSLPKYAEMVRSMDQNIGRVLDTLDKKGMLKNTIVVFTSDNGGERYSHVWPFIGMKGELLEGGLRVPGIITWPGHIKPGSRCEQINITMDWLPTLLAAVGAEPDPAYPPDGMNILPMILGKSEPVPRTFYWRFKSNVQVAIRDGDWKYVKLGESEGLFNIAEDVRERANKIHEHPDLVKKLKDKFVAWNKDMLPYNINNFSIDNKGVLMDRY